MAQTLLDAISLGYQLLWSPERRPVAVRLFVGTDPSSAIDARHLLATLREFWPGHAPPLLLSIQAPLLLRSVLGQGRDEDPRIEVPLRWLGNAALLAELQAAQQRGLVLVGLGAPDDTLPLDVLSQLMLPPEFGAQETPEFPGLLPSGLPHLYIAPEQRAQAAALLRHPDTWALAGWPTDDVVQAYQGRGGVPPDRHGIETLLGLIEADASLEAIENRICHDPVLAYRFLHHLNRPETGLRQPVQSIHHGLLLTGYGTLQTWLHAQLPQASDDIDLQPVRQTMILRADLMERLIEPGEEEDLRREVHLCGLFSQLDQLLDQPMEDVLAQLPLSERVRTALLQRTGPYAASLQIVRALESAATHATRAFCQDNDRVMEDVNRALLRALLAQVDSSMVSA